MRTRDKDRLWREAGKLCAAAPATKALPPLFFVTDPARTPDPTAVARTLPRGCGVIYRSFGDPGAVRVGQALAAVARDRGLVLLIGADPDLAAEVGAHGVHLPERLAGRARRLRTRQPGWIITGAAHSARALAEARRLGLDAALLSPIFDSRSLSAGRPLGIVRFAALVRGAGLPVYALGGVDARTVMRLRGSGAAGVAAVEGIAGRF